MDFIRMKICLSVLLFLNVWFCTAFDVSTIPFNKGFSHLFGDANILHATDDNSLQLHLNQNTGSGFKSSDLYNHGLFSAKIKLPSDYTAGIVVAFYTTNQDVFKKTHDELDFEFLGNIKGKAWRFQTNMYGNGSTHRGREERYTLWFDPSKEFHRYTILWTNKNIIFYIDDVPIREIVRNDTMGGDYPSKPMGLYATIWDASDWATSGGKYKTNYKYAPFIAEFTDLVLNGCAMDPLEQVVNPNNCDEKDVELQKAVFSRITPRQRMAMKRFRAKYMYYSYCYDSLRYSVPPTECEIDPVEQRRFKETGRLKFNKHHGHGHRHPKIRSTSQVLDARISENEDED
ncbi:putative xyloglucan endotransglucosylase/hydrolase protein 28 [Capsicum annuum]|uniref:probable xyloglucan endotransglucosylase/hydrolase protein 30 n=1 Tax=Capsicum annuum TaxID=4072 RepID=UPI001FB14727|nr:probable xyloglucan endotransglucosylase/hydrolase protein 30 [Capsicum annuum]KAF3621241.1 putative xyloglucan endotransglucosylase/hydrolase protein 28 [Capsicum annuum]